MNLNQKNKAELIQLIDQLQSDDANATVAALQGQLSDLESKISNLNEQLNEAARPSAANNDEVAEYQTIIKGLQQRIAAYEKVYGPQFFPADNHLVHAKGNIMVDGKVITPTMLATDPVLLQRELKKGNKMLEVVA